MSIYNISIHLNFYQHRFINECVRKKKKVGGKKWYKKCLMLKLGELLWPSMTLEVILVLRIHDISNHINFYQNLFINECVRMRNKVGQNWMNFCELQWQSGTKMWDKKEVQKVVNAKIGWTFMTFNDHWGHTCICVFMIIAFI